MPRNGVSVYSLPAGNPVVPGTTISTAWANGTLTDIATALTQSLSTDGSTTSASMSGKTLVGGTYNGPTVTGTMNLNGGIIAFPAVQIPSAGANDLDDYEEGTWTPSITFSTPGNLSVTYSNRVGTYTKIGDSVSLNLRIATSGFTHTTASGNLQVTGMPFATNGTSGYIAAGAIGYFFGITLLGGDSTVGVLVAAASTLMQFNNSNYNTGAGSVVTTAAVPTAVQKDFAITIDYKV